MRTNRAQDSNIALNRNDCKGKPETARARAREKVKAGEEEISTAFLKKCLRSVGFFSFIAAIVVLVGF